ncbi:MAG: hypothetical protein RMY29_031735 [Nostoc sp. CreGUA01]|nr:hypothetical protein [Nostoc sp. CreGUA01]
MGHWALGFPGSLSGVGGWGRNLSPHTPPSPSSPSSPSSPFFPCPMPQIN